MEGLTSRGWIIVTFAAAIVAVGGYAFFRCSLEMMTADTLFAATHQAATNTANKVSK